MDKIKQAVILAGGQGKRLRPFTENNPKPMAPVLGKPFLEHLILMLRENKIKEVVILTGYLGEKIKDYFKDGSNLGINIKYSHTPFENEQGQENESGLRLKNAKDLLDEHFLLMYCDNYWPLQIEKLEEFYNSHNADILTTIYSNKDNSTKNNVLVDSSSYVEKYDRERQDAGLNGLDIGFFIINKKVLDLLPEGNSHFEKDILPKLVSEKKVAGFLTDHKYYSISDQERLKATEKFLQPKKTIFLDRDGVINKKALQANYIKNWQEFEFLPEAIDSIKQLTENGYDIYLITNQPGIARGSFTKQDLDLTHQKMQEEIEKQGGKIKTIYACLHNWDEGCECRKPKPGLLFQAAKENHLDLTKAIFVGDDPRDVEAGQLAGCKTILVNPEVGVKEAIKHIIN
jgi:D-glycero-D-manno-heptose 1,7-bisphosphate phosphatase